jgi:hypothetical protein
MVGKGLRVETNYQVAELLEALPTLSVDDCEYLARLHRLARSPAESSLLATDVAMRLERAADLMALRAKVDAAFPTRGPESIRHAARDVARSAAAALLFRDDISAPEFNALYQPFDDFWVDRRPDDPSPLAK